MRRYYKINSKIILFILLIASCSLSVFILSSRDYTARQEIVPSQTVEIIITSSIDPLEDGSYLIGSELTFKIPDVVTYTSAEIILTGQTRAFILTLTKSGATWFVKWNTQEPSAGDAPAEICTYTITLKINDGATDCSPTKLSIANEPMDPMIIIVLILIVAGVGVGGLVVVKLKKGKEGDVTFDEVDKSKSKKKGKVYSGASSIGKRSGAIAESKGDSKTSVLDTPSASSGSQGGVHFKAIKGAFGVDTSKPEKKQLMPADSSFKFETKVAQSAAMVKSMELKMDLKSKINFLTSKVGSLLSNIEFFKAILQQQDQEDFACPTCNIKAQTYWVVCPFCEIREHEAELGLQQSMMSIGGNVGFCPGCKRIVQPSWSECPFCFVKDK